MPGARDAERISFATECGAVIATRLGFIAALVSLFRGRCNNVPALHCRACTVYLQSL